MSSRRNESSASDWLIIEPLLPNKPRALPRVDDRRVLNGIYWRLRTGSPWAAIPDIYGSAMPYSGLCAGVARVSGIGCLQQLRRLMQARYR